MSKSSSMSAYEIRREGWKALTERLGAAGADLELEELLAAVRRQETGSSEK
jgi:hypothetical protein